MQQHTERLGSAPLASLLVRLSLPSIAATVTASLYNVVDTFWVARLGYEAIAALTIVFPYQILAVAIGIGTGIGVSALVSRHFGENDIGATNHVAGQIFSASVFWGLVFLLAAVFFSEDILVLFGATPDIMDQSTKYLVLTAYGAPAHVFALVAGNLIRGSGDAVRPMVIMISASVLNIILDPFMILGIGPFPEMGIRGAALATVIAQSVGALIGLYYLLGHRTTFRFTLRHLVPSWPILRDIYKVGTPASIQEITESLSFVLFNNVVSAFGSIAIAAVGLIIRVSDLMFMPIIGVSNALLPVVGYNYGAKNEKRVWQAVKLSSLGLAVLLGLSTIIYEVWAPQIVGIFSRNQELLDMTVPAMRIMLSTMIFIGPSIMFVTVFQGLSKGTMALFLSLIRQFLMFVPLLYILSHFFDLQGVWLALPISDVLSFLVTFVFLYREYLKRKHAAAAGI
ncbi:MAG: MATE family efflux transporter [Dehalococcoidales bacterium]|nr:MATE family efflux transporter [Dehalococcoidales bacterium]